MKKLELKNLPTMAKINYQKIILNDEEVEVKNNTISIDDPTLSKYEPAETTDELDTYVLGNPKLFDIKRTMTTQRANIPLMLIGLLSSGKDIRFKHKSEIIDKELRSTLSIKVVE